MKKHKKMEKLLKSLGKEVIKKEKKEEIEELKIEPEEFVEKEIFMVDEE